MAIVIVRSLIVYLALLVTMRLLGKRQLGEMELSEFVLAALIADLAAHPLQDLGIPMINGLVPIITLFCCEVIIAGITMKSIRLRSVLWGRPSMLIYKGRINQHELKKNRYTVDELLQELRSQSLTDISKVEYAILETDGKLNVLLYPAEKPVTAAMMEIHPSDTGYPAVVISDGHVLDENLRLVGYDNEWLRDKLCELNITSVKSVFLMTVNSAGQIFWQAKEANA